MKDGAQPSLSALQTVSIWPYKYNHFSPPAILFPVRKHVGQGFARIMREGHM